MSFFKKLFAKAAPNVDLSQIDEKAESDFNEAFASLVNEQVSAVATTFEDRIKALEQKETPQAFDASELTAKIEALQSAKAEANTQLETISKEFAKFKLESTNKPAANAGNEPPSLVTTEKPKGYKNLNQ